MTTCTSPWFAGLTCDHLFADCPNRTRGEAELRRWGWWGVGTDHPRATPDIDPHGEFVCGMCLHRHNQREHATTPPPGAPGATTTRSEK